MRSSRFASARAFAFAAGGLAAALFVMPVPARRSERASPSPQVAQPRAIAEGLLPANWTYVQKDKLNAWCVAQEEANQERIDAFFTSELARIGDRAVPRHGYRTSDLLQSAVLHIRHQLPEHTCRSDADGAWVLRFDGISGSLLDHFDDDPSGQTYSVNGPDGPDANYVAFHVAIATSRVFRSAAGDERSDRGDPLLVGAQGVGDRLEFTDPTALVLADIDGDGAPEALIVSESGSQELYEGLPDVKRSSVVYTAAPFVHLLPGVPTDVLIEDLVDTDDDGRADLVVRGPSLGIVTGGGLWDEEGFGPSRVIRSMRDGTFVREDP